VDLALARPTVSATVDTLVERGLVERAATEDDRRVLRLTLSGTGRSALRKAEAAMRTHLEDVLQHVERPDDVRRALAALAAGLDERRDQRRAARARS
jgi:DNA-binding MarR family transcriptional regulator